MRRQADNVSPAKPCNVEDSGQHSVLFGEVQVTSVQRIACPVRKNTHGLFALKRHCHRAADGLCGCQDEGGRRC